MILRKSKSSLVVTLIFLNFLAVTLFAFNAYSYSGHADHVIVIIDRLNREGFDPNQDLTKKTRLEDEWGDFHKIVSRSALESLMPLASFVKGNDVVSNNILQTIIHSSSISLTRLSEEALKVFQEKRAFLPFYHDIYLIPTDDTERDTFYNNDKVTLTSIDQINMLGVADETSEKFQKVVTQNIKKLQKKYSASKDPFSLLAFRRSVILSKQQQNLRYIFLLQLQPRIDDFVKDSDKVNIKKVIIPDSTYCNFGSAVALVTFTLNFSKDGAKKEPDLNIQFGSFDKFEHGIFWLKHQTEDEDKCIPRFEGEVAGKAGKFIGITFGFKNIEMDLTKQEVTGLDVLTRPGLKLGRNRSFAPLFFNAESIDKEFTGEFNKTIKEEIQKLLDKTFGSLKKPENK